MSEALVHDQETEPIRILRNDDPFTGEGDGEDGGDQVLPSIYFHATFGGGDPTATRVRDVSVTVPVLPADWEDVGGLVAGVVKALVGLSGVTSIETRVGQQ